MESLNKKLNHIVGGKPPNGGTGRRRGTPIPVLPPRIPTPVPPPESRTNHRHSTSSTTNAVPPPAPAGTSKTSHAPSLRSMKQKYLENNMEQWIDPRLLSKVDSDTTKPLMYGFARSSMGHQELHGNHRRNYQKPPTSTHHELSCAEDRFKSTPRRHIGALASTTSASYTTENNTSSSTQSRVFTNGCLSTNNYTNMNRDVTPPSQFLRSGTGSDSRNSKIHQSSSSRTNHQKTSNSQVSQYLYEDNLLLEPKVWSSVGYSGFKYSSRSSSNGSLTQSSAAAAFFARAAQKLNLSSHRRKRHSYGEDEDTDAGFCGVIHRSAPQIPQALLRRLGTKDVTGVGKVRVLLRVNGSVPENSTGNFFTIDTRKKQVTLFDPTACNGCAAPEDRQVGVTAPKMFAFDSIFTDQASQVEVCTSALTEVIHAVISGTDGCVFCFGHARLGKTHTMIGSPESGDTIGIVPCAIAWLFRGISEQKQKTGARFSVRVSAIEVTGSSQNLKDLLLDHADEYDQSPGVYLRDDPLFGTQLQNQTELRVSTPEKAAFYLDAALTARSTDVRDHHLLYTLHLYQYNVTSRGRVAGGRSRLHLLDLGSCERGKVDGGISLSGLGNVLLAIFNGHKHLPHREHKVSQLLKECLGSLTCYAAMIAHVSPDSQHYTDTLSAVQLASRIHRMRRHKIKFGGGSAGSGGSSGDDNPRGHPENGHSTGSSDIDPSSSEQSADTVIYVGPSDEATDGEHPPVYIPSLNSGDMRCAMGKVLSGSAAERKQWTSTSLPSSPAKHSSPSKIPNGNVVHDKSGSPHHHSSGAKSSSQVMSSGSTKPSGSGHNSSKSSPSRNSSKTGNLKSTSNDQGSKIPILFNPNAGSEEQWVDGPRISKSKVAEARNLLKDSHKKKETWIDGPLQSVKVSGTAQGYGYMDSHKKNMIKKWVENQSVHLQGKNVKHVAPLPRPPTTGAEQTPCKEMTVFKTCDSEENQSDDKVSLKSIENSDQEEISRIKSLLSSSQYAMDKVSQDEKCALVPRDSDIMYENILKQTEQSIKTNECSFAEKKSIDTCLKSMYIDETTDKIISLQDHLDITRTEIADDPKDKMMELNQEIIAISKMNIGGGAEEGEEEADGCDINDSNAIDDCDIDIHVGDDVEFIEVEEPLEPVQMQDLCLQVTEEDIAMCMAEVEAIMHEETEDNIEDHPLRILSQENLTVVSTFTDSLSVATDLEHTLPSQYHSEIPAYESSFHHRPYSLHELTEDHIGSAGFVPYHNVMSDRIVRRAPANSDQSCHESKHHQLTELHEMFKTKLARTNSCKISTPCEDDYQIPYKFHSLSLSDVFCGSDWRGQHVSDKYIRSGGGSIFSEPVYNHKESSNDKLCYNCKVNLCEPEKNLLYQTMLLGGNKDTLMSHLPLHKENGVRFKSKLTGSWYNISSLRHPDGASNPDLKEETERIPGNGASNGEHDKQYNTKNKTQDDFKKENIRKNSEQDDDLLPRLPPPLMTPTSSHLQSRLFSKCGSKSKLSIIEGSDSGQDSSSPRPSKAKPLLSSRVNIPHRPNCESSDYESILRDSECSSTASSLDSDVEVPQSHDHIHDPGGSPRVPVLQYCREDVERLERRWSQTREGRLRELLQEQQYLKKELAAAKKRLLIPNSRWSYERASRRKEYGQQGPEFPGSSWQRNTHSQEEG